MPAENTAKKQRGRQFKAGKSGNPAGRPPGALNKATLAAQELLDGEAETLTRKAIDLAKAGNMDALRLCLSRLVPPRKDRPLVLDVPEIDGTNGLRQASAALLRAVTTGEITPAEGQAVASMLDGHRKVVELAEVERRVAALEERQGGQP